VRGKNCLRAASRSASDSMNLMFSMRGRSRGRTYLEGSSGYLPRCSAFLVTDLSNLPSCRRRAGKVIAATLLSAWESRNESLSLPLPHHPLPCRRYSRFATAVSWAPTKRNRQLTCCSLFRPPPKNLPSSSSSSASTSGASTSSAIARLTKHS
jgi:hypothetical protein